MTEYQDLYDRGCRKLGRLHRRGDPLAEGTYFLVVNVWIVNSLGEVLIAQRHTDKKMWGGLWECAASGGVLAGEDSLQGALRETREEIGVDLDPSEAVLLETLVRRDNIRDTFLFRRDIDLSGLTLQPGEVADARWVTPEGYDDLCGKGLMAPPVMNFRVLYPLWR